MQVWRMWLRERCKRRSELTGKRLTATLLCSVTAQTCGKWAYVSCLLLEYKFRHLFKSNYKLPSSRQFFMHTDQQVHTLSFLTHRSAGQWRQVFVLAGRLGYDAAATTRLAADVADELASNAQPAAAAAVLLHYLGDVDSGVAALTTARYVCLTAVLVNWVCTRAVSTHRSKTGKDSVAYKVSAFVTCVDGGEGGGGNTDRRNRLCFC